VLASVARVIRLYTEPARSPTSTWPSAVVDRLRSEGIWVRRTDGLSIAEALGESDWRDSDRLAGDLPS
jgi:hypothetical protein